MLDRGNGFLGARQEREDFAGVALQGRTCLCELNAPPPARKKRRAQARFQVLHMLAYSRLCHQQPLRCAAETARLRHRCKDFEFM
jgi:hypothetical protein